MKKRILICCSVLLAVICIIGIFAVQSSKIVGEEGLIATARKEIENLAEAETVEMTVAGKSTIVLDCYRKRISDAQILSA